MAVEDLASVPEEARFVTLRGEAGHPLGGFSGCDEDVHGDLIGQFEPVAKTVNLHRNV